MVKRNMIHTKRMPEMLSDVTVQPIMFVLLFAFVFGASIATGGGASYREFLLPGIQAQTIVFTAFVVASGITADVEKGIIDRFRSLPISRSSVLIGRSVASLLHSTIGVVVMAVTGLAIGWRIRGSVAEAVLAFALILVFGFGMIWFGILIGSVMRSVEAVNGVMFTVLFPITFLANTFAPTEPMQHWLRVIAEWNPVSSLAQAMRELWGNGGPAPAERPAAAAPSGARDHSVVAGADGGLRAVRAACLRAPHRRLGLGRPLRSPEKGTVTHYAIYVMIAKMAGAKPKVAVIGAGPGGIAMGIQLADGGYDFTIFDRGDGFGGTWRNNTYPGAACDVPSHFYSYSFALNPRWSKTFANQPEILAYLEKVAADNHLGRPPRHAHPRHDAAVVGHRARWTLRPTTVSRDSSTSSSPRSACSMSPTSPTSPALSDSAAAGSTRRAGITRNRLRVNGSRPSAQAPAPSSTCRRSRRTPRI